MIGITSINGYPIPLEQRFQKIKMAGFDSLLLWWGGDEACSRRERVDLARQYGLNIENAHATTDHMNALWLEGACGEHTAAELKQEIIECAEYGVGTLVVHLTNGSAPPPLSKPGIFRIEQLIRIAEEAGVRLAFENVRKADPVRYVLDQYPSPYVGLCYDSGHEHLWSPGIDWLAEYGQRVFAVHLHDNHGKEDSHYVPFDGDIDWGKKSKQIAGSSYTGAVTIESEMRASSRYENDGLEAFLSYACQKGRELAAMIGKTPLGE